jgi:hypothetical protein
LKAELLVVVMRDIARAEMMGHCTQAYLASAAEMLRSAEEAPRVEAPEPEMASA